jgi:hypothetical protein
MSILMMIVTHRWAEKERLLTHFARHRAFPADRRGFPARRALDTRGQQFEGSAIALLQLTLVPFALPVLMLASIPVSSSYHDYCIAHMYDC